MVFREKSRKADPDRILKAFRSSEDKLMLTIHEFVILYGPIVISYVTLLK